MTTCVQKRKRKETRNRSGNELGALGEGGMVASACANILFPLNKARNLPNKQAWPRKCHPKVGSPLTRRGKWNRAALTGEMELCDAVWSKRVAFCHCSGKRCCPVAPGSQLTNSGRFCFFSFSNISTA